MMRRYAIRSAIALSIAYRSAASDDAQNHSGRGNWIAFQLALPESNWNPSGGAELVVHVLIPSPVARDLGDPISRVGASCKLEPLTGPIPSVPKVPITKDCHACAWKDEIWTPWNGRCMQAETATQLVDRLT